jgi:serine/threonine protein kinase
VYASPEQREEGRIAEVYPSSDLYSLAVTCLELLTGITPVDYLDNNYRNWRQQARLIISPSLANILDKMLKINPRHRFQSAAEVMTAVNESQITTQPDHSVNNNNNNTKPINKPSHNLKFLLIKSAFLITLITIGVMGINIYLQPFSGTSFTDYENLAEQQFFINLMSDLLITDIHTVPYTFAFRHLINKIHWIPIDNLTDNEAKQAMMNLFKKYHHKIDLPMDEPRLHESGPEKLKIYQAIKHIHKNKKHSELNIYLLYTLFADDLKFYRQLVNTFDPQWSVSNT